MSRSPVSLASTASASSRMSSPSGVRSTTISFSRSLSMRLCSAKSISAAPPMTIAKTDSGSGTNSPFVSSRSSRTISSGKLSISASAHRGGGRSRVGLDREDRVETANREHLADIGGKPAERHLALLLLHLFRHDQEHAQPGAADVIEAAHVDSQ